MKKIIAIAIIYLALSHAAKGQLLGAISNDSTNVFQDAPAAKKIDTPGAVRTIIQAAQDTKDKRPDSIINEENNVAKLELIAQKLKLEKEIAALKGKGDLTDEDREILRMRNENLKIILLKEKIMLDQELEAMKKQNVKTNLPHSTLYGHDFFRNGSFKFFDKTDAVVATESYVLGTGDVVQLEVWGFRYWSKSYVVSESGSIDIPGYQKIFVKGMSLKQAREVIGARLGVSGGESSYSVTVTRPRIVSVNVLGEVFSPGTYSIPATNSAFNILVSMGGPSDIGSVRNIYIKRDGKIADSFDLYEYFNDVRHQRDIFLQNNDYIIVMPLGTVVQIGGSVRRPGNYELKKGEGLLDLIRFAGGFNPNSYLKEVVLSRIRNNQYELVNLNVDSLIKTHNNYSLAGGENIFFNSIGLDNQNTILITGAVNVPGVYYVKPGMHISDVIKNANGLRSNVFLDKAYLLRTNKDLTKTYFTFNPGELAGPKKSPNDLVVENRDSIFIFTNTENQKFYDISISGAVYKQLNTRYIAGVKLSELIFMAGGITPDADDKKGFIVRTNTDYVKSLIPFEPGRLLNKEANYDFELLPRDVVTIYSKAEFKRSYTLNIQGPVKAPRTIDYAENTRVSDMINQAGGLEVNAYRGRALLIRSDLETGYKTVKTLNLENILTNPSSDENILLSKNDIIRIFDLSELRNDFQVSVYGEVRKPGLYDYADNMTLQNLVDMSGGLQYISAGTTIEIVRNFVLKDGVYKFMKPEVVFTKIADNLTIDADIQGYTLQPFDRVFIRKNPNFIPLKLVYIEGAVQFPGTYALMGENEKLYSIFNRAGGFKNDAMIRGVKLKRLRLPGDTLEIIINTRKAIHRKRSHFNVIVKNGDYIYVPYAESIVTLSGDINKQTDRDIGAYYIRHKRANYYIKKFGGGFTETSNRKKVVVLKANGARVATRNYVFFKVYPRVRLGSKIIVESKPGTVKGRTGNKASTVDVDKFLSKLLTRATAVLSLLAIYKIATAK